MPSVASLPLGVNPSADPIRYPGNIVQGDCLLAESWIYPLHFGGKAVISDWSVAIDGGPLKSKSQRTTRLDSALSQLAATAMGQRYPVLAVGSNASPGQLIHKFSRTSERTIVPFTAARVSGMAVAHSAHVSPAGYIPYRPTLSINATRLSVLWLDRNQLVLLDATEPNYKPLTISGLDRPAVIEASQEPLSSYSVYRSRWGVLRIPLHDAPVAAATQEAVFSLLAETGWFPPLLPELGVGLRNAMTRLAADSALRDSIRSRLAACQLSRSDELGESSAMPTTYDASARAAL